RRDPAASARTGSSAAVPPAGCRGLAALPSGGGRGGAPDRAQPPRGGSAAGAGVVPVAGDPGPDRRGGVGVRGLDLDDPDPPAAPFFRGGRRDRGAPDPLIGCFAQWCAEGTARPIGAVSPARSGPSRAA